MAATQDPTQMALLAVNALFHNPDKEDKRKANEWLSEFQHTEEAWQTCHGLLTSTEVPQEARMMAAQTLRSKVVYDLKQLPKSSLPSLRDSFLQSLTIYASPTAPAGSRTIVTQLCLALADLAFQMPEWKDVVPSMVDNFGTRAECVEMLLEFLKSLVEEASNGRIPISSSEASERSYELLSSQNERILTLLAMYINAPGVTPRLQGLVFETLRSWLQAGELDATLITKSPLFAFAFEALGKLELFDQAVDVICDLIHETQEVEEHVDSVQLIVPRVIGLRQAFLSAFEAEDDDSVRGYCRIFTEAGETYQQLILQHPDTFTPLVQVIGECASYHDLDIVPITFDFWWRLADALQKQSPEAKSSIYVPYMEVYAKLQEAMTVHLRFPQDESSQTAAQRDDFRQFRHRMGDTLKDCCSVLGSNVCMKRAYDSVMAALQKGAAASWQEIEAPLFSIRAMGAQVDAMDESVLPLIMDMLPTLPRQTRIQYAAILVISRYTHWIAAHPQYLPFQLNYISEGFNVTENDVSLAAALAMKFMCQDCQEHLVPYLGQLHSFVTTAGLKLTLEEKLDVAEAIGYVIGSMGEAEAAEALQRFTQPLLEQIQQACTGPTLSTSEELDPVVGALDQLEAYIVNVKSLTTLPATCVATPNAVYGVIEELLAKYSSSYGVADKATRVIRRGLSFFPEVLIRPLVPRILARSVACFESSGHSSYIWLVDRVASSLGGKGRATLAAEESAVFEGALTSALEQLTSLVKSSETQQGATQIPDVLDDYLHMIRTYVKRVPSIILSNPSLPTIFDLCLVSLTLPSSGAVMNALEAIMEFFDAGTQPGSAYVETITGAAKTYGERIVTIAINGMVQEYIEETQDVIIDIVKELVKLCPGEARGWTLSAVQGLPGHVAPTADKTDFFANFEKVFAETNLDLVRPAIRIFWRSTRRAADRKERMRSSLGGGGR